MVAQAGLTSVRPVSRNPVPQSPVWATTQRELRLFGGGINPIKLEMPL
ncbi:hypothetical protein ACMV8I_08930 [Ewingella sp. S1.OA.A_B6]